MSTEYKLIRNSGPRVSRSKATIVLVTLVAVVLAAILSGLLGAPLQAAHASTTDDTDAGPDQSDLSTGDWGVDSEGESIPIHRVPTTDGRDIYGFEITEEATYRLAVTNAPEGVGVWSISNDEEELVGRDYPEPFCDLSAIYGPGRYTLEIRHRDGSTGNTDAYTITLVRVTDD